MMTIMIILGVVCLIGLVCITSKNKWDNITKPPKGWTPTLNKPVVSSSCGCVISWGVGFYDVKEGKDITHNVTNIFIDSFSSMVTVTIEKGMNKVYTVKFSMNYAQEIGFINIKALSNYC